MPTHRKSWGVGKLWGCRYGIEYRVQPQSNACTSTRVHPGKERLKRDVTHAPGVCLLPICWQTTQSQSHRSNFRSLLQKYNFSAHTTVMQEVETHLGPWIAGRVHVAHTFWSVTRTQWNQEDNYLDRNVRMTKLATATFRDTCLLSGGDAEFWPKNCASRRTRVLASTDL